MRKVIVVSENALFRRGLQNLVAQSPHATVLGTVASLDEAVRLSHQSRPDVVILDQAQDTADQGQALAQLLDLALDRIVAVTLDNQSITVYSRRRLQETSAQTLLDLLSSEA